MTPAVIDHVEPGPAAAEDEPHLLVGIHDARARRTVTGQLLDAGFRVTTAATYGLVEVLLANATQFELLVTAQSFGEMGQFGLPQLARSVRPNLPILVLELEAAGGIGVLNAVRDALRRWPLRTRPQRSLH
jgi:hypothetical protein